MFGSPPNLLRMLATTTTKLQAVVDILRFRSNLSVGLRCADHIGFTAVVGIRFLAALLALRCVLVLLGILVFLASLAGMATFAGFAFVILTVFLAALGGFCARFACLLVVPARLRSLLAIFARVLVVAACLRPLLRCVVNFAFLGISIRSLFTFPARSTASTLPASGLTAAVGRVLEALAAIGITTELLRTRTLQKGGCNASIPYNRRRRTMHLASLLAHAFLLTRGIPGRLLLLFIF
mmetsp:Transcript_90769/g.256313  ORF Transcript_90769/g.256313 Transcript_90769/m.256313 type:complete len:238 (+) Transcript_90769:433-1146(+)